MTEIAWIPACAGMTDNERDIDVIKSPGAGLCSGQALRLGDENSVGRQA